MELFTTPAFNLLGVALVQARTFTRYGDCTPVTAIIPEFDIDQFMVELEELKDFDSYEDEDDFEINCPLIYKYLLKGVPAFHKLSEVEVDWIIDMGIPPAFPRYFQGYELK